MTTEVDTRARQYSLSDRIIMMYYGAVMRPYIIRYLRKPRRFKYGKLQLTIQPSVFHPAFFFSSKLMAAFTNSLSLKGKKFCEVGLGSGLMSFIAYSKGADVFSFDINPVAINAARENFNVNFPARAGSDFQVCESDLFDSIPKLVFDVVMINPPFYFKQRADYASYAWNCGVNGEYYHKLFKQLADYANESTEIYINLADCCDLQRIFAIAKEYGYAFSTIVERKIKWEVQYILAIHKM